MIAAWLICSKRKHDGELIGKKQDDRAMAHRESDELLDRFGSSVRDRPTHEGAWAHKTLRHGTFQNYEGAESSTGMGNARAAKQSGVKGFGDGA